MAVVCLQGAVMAEMPKTFAAFWPYYVQAHLDRRCRVLHYIGTGLGLAVLVQAIVALNPAWLLLGPLFGYGFAWAGHFLFERNRPAAWIKPWWSLLGDYKMFALGMTGQLGPHLERARDHASLEAVHAQAQSGGQ